MASECIDKPSNMVERMNIYNKISKSWPESKCINLTGLAKTYYDEFYKQYGMDYQNCPQRNKVYIVDSSCSRMKMGIDYANSNIDCVGKTVDECNRLIEKDRITQLEKLINKKYKECVNDFGSCSVYEVNGIRYNQDNKYFIILICILILCLCISSVVIIGILINII